MIDNINVSKSKSDLRIIKVDLTDDKILHGEIDLGITVRGLQVIVHFPSHSQWSEYWVKVASFLQLLVLEGVNFNTEDFISPDIQNDNDRWLMVQSLVIQTRSVHNLLDEIFFEYLSPSVKGLEYPKTPEPTEEELSDPMFTTQEFIYDFRDRYQKAWLKKYMDSGHTFAMLQSIFYVDEWFKKKAQITLRSLNLLSNPMKQSSKPILQESLESPTIQLETELKFGTDSNSQN